MARRFRFNTLTLMLMTGAAAVMSFFFTTHGVAGASIAGATFVCWRSFICTQRYFHKPVWLLFGLVGLWFLCVHWVYEARRCDACETMWEEYRDEAIGIPVAKEREYWPSPISVIANDLSCPCSHPIISVRWREDYLGRVYDPYYFRGTKFLMTGEDGEWLEWYAKAVRPSVQTLRESNPELVAEFCERVIEEGDREYFWNEFAEKHLPPLYPHLDE